MLTRWVSWWLKLRCCDTVTAGEPDADACVCVCVCVWVSVSDMSSLNGCLCSSSFMMFDSKWIIHLIADLPEVYARNRLWLKPGNSLTVIVRLTSRVSRVRSDLQTFLISVFNILRYRIWKRLMAALFPRFWTVCNVTDTLWQEQTTTTHTPPPCLSQPHVKSHIFIQLFCNSKFVFKGNMMQNEIVFYDNLYNERLPLKRPQQEPQSRILLSGRTEQNNRSRIKWYQICEEDPGGRPTFLRTSCINADAEYQWNVYWRHISFFIVFAKVVNHKSQKWLWASDWL